jgi:predicted transcriptional regulator/plasmid maintenance system antidote protein VapI
MSKAYKGVRLQRLREERGLSQVALAKALGISASYLNQIERNQRPLTVPILLRINQEFGVDVQMFSEGEEAQLVTELREVLAENGGESVTVAELRSLVDNTPAVARSIIELHRRVRVANERADGLLGPLGDQQRLPAFSMRGPHEEVRDYFNGRHDHVEELDERAESIFRDAGLIVGNTAPRLGARLREKHGVQIVVSRAVEMGADKRRFDPGTRTLRLVDFLRPGQQAFQMAFQLALLEVPEILEALVLEGKFSGEESRRLARVGLANYFAGALTMPYNPFLEAAEELAYDIECLANRFAVGFEAICHRLATLQRPGAQGLPFFFVRVDRAGNVSKRHSADDFHFSRVGGTCPLWIVYEAFTRPERVLTQVATMPDGRSYFWIAKQVVSGPIGYGRPQKTFAVSLGCDLRHAHRMVYSRGLDLTDPRLGAQIGLGCKVCERRECPQRAFPSLLHPGVIGLDRS